MQGRGHPGSPVGKSGSAGGTRLSIDPGKLRKAIRVRKSETDKVRNHGPRPVQPGQGLFFLRKNPENTVKMTTFGT